MGAGGRWERGCYSEYVITQRGEAAKVDEIIFEKLCIGLAALLLERRRSERGEFRFE